MPLPVIMLHVLLGSTEEEAEEVAALGDEVLPLVFDALFSRDEFKAGYWQYNALRVLSYSRNQGLIPWLRNIP